MSKSGTLQVNACDGMLFVIFVVYIYNFYYVTLMVEIMLSFTMTQRTITVGSHALTSGIYT